MIFDTIYTAAQHNEHRLNNMKEYIYDSEAVKLTGRTAKKVASKNNSQPQRRRVITSTADKILHEIAPIDSTFDWKKWVPLDELFEVIDDDKQQLPETESE